MSERMVWSADPFLRNCRISDDERTAALDHIATQPDADTLAAMCGLTGDTNA